jgi:tetratricopeptide (TPR) repeat protein
MIRHWIALLVTLMFAASALAQDAPTPPAPAETTELAAAELAATAEWLAGQVERAERAVDQAFNLLGLFEAFGLIIAVVGGALGALGITRLFLAQNELAATRARIEAGLHELEEDLEGQIREKEARLEHLREDLIARFDNEHAALRDRTSRALLAQSLLALGERQYRVRDLRGAIATYTRAIALDHDNPIAHYRQGYVHVHLGQFDAAEASFRQSLALEPDFALAKAGFGFALRRKADSMEHGTERDILMNEAERNLLEALAANPNLVDDDNESWWGALGGLYRRTGQMERAIRAYERATEVTPHSSYGYGNLAQLYALTQDHQRMLKTYERVEKLAWASTQADVNNYWDHADVVTARLALGKADGAMSMLPDALALASSAWECQALVDTLTRLAGLVSPAKQGTIQAAIEQIEAYAAERFSAGEADG